VCVCVWWVGGDPCRCEGGVGSRDVGAKYANQSSVYKCAGETKSLRGKSKQIKDTAQTPLYSHFLVKKKKTHTHTRIHKQQQHAHTETTHNIRRYDPEEHLQRSRPG
jgi:hypothetical protein